MLIILTDVSCINRIRLEFKVHYLDVLNNLVLVLIESDWNLKANISGLKNVRRGY